MSQINVVAFSKRPAEPVSKSRVPKEITFKMCGKNVGQRKF